MHRKLSKLTAAIVLSFFTWTSGGVFSVAHAAVDAAQKSSTQVPAQRAEGADDKLARLTDELTVALADSKTNQRT